MYGATAGGRKGKDVSSIEFTSPELQAKPASIRKLESVTHFTRKELQSIYQGFKKVCPTGYASKDTFIQVYQSFFPSRASAAYAQMCFRVFDKERSGELTFEQFARVLSQITRGTEAEKIDWIFSLYDLNGDGYISRVEVNEVATAIFDLVRVRSENSRDLQTIEERVNTMMELFTHPQTYDLNHDGKISKEEFFSVSTNDSDFLANLNIFGTQL
ncbi:Guanylyl cyclase-activating protein 2 [Paragonimus heterotremus]|uniref:Guanylyl cyclase-activating protein 2 n=1 Tax=Paragonimus heterotremus TaxID=100268 RepID=A0A8J4WVI6_9TREM|nr:Guanylyl cyclase-activating protein 2 [Paragonimus heterotremus]